MYKEPIPTKNIVSSSNEDMITKVRRSASTSHTPTRRQHMTLKLSKCQYIARFSPHLSTTDTQVEKLLK